MDIAIPVVPEAEQTPLLQQLLEIIQQQAERLQQQTELIQQLRAEIAALKNLPPKPKITPSKLEQPPPSAQTGAAPANHKRPGSAKRHKNAQLTIHDDKVLKPDQVPQGSIFKGYEDFVVQDLVLKTYNVRYRRERWRTLDGQTVLADLPDSVVRTGHFGPDLICFILHQYHHNHVTQPLLLEQLQQLGIDISSGQINRILTENKDLFHQEKAELLPVGLTVSSYVHADDTGARHEGQQGYCTHVGNEYFAYFESTDCKSRINFLKVLRGTHQDYVLDEVALAYLQEQKFPQGLYATLAAGPHCFVDGIAWDAHLAALGMSDERHVRIATEAALLGSLLSHGVSGQLAIVSDDAGQFDILVHALCWVHAERTLAKLIPFNDKYRQKLEEIRTQVWEFYGQLKEYKKAPNPEWKATLEARFDSLFASRTGFSTIDGALQRLLANKAELLLVLTRPELPLHNNLSENDLRDYVKKRKISGSTRSTLGRRCRDTFASLKKTCRKLGIGFWNYLQDRVRGLSQIPRLAERIRQKAEELVAGKAQAALPVVVGGDAAD
jgi:Transposase IS66 family